MSEEARRYLRPGVQFDPVAVRIGKAMKLCHPAAPAELRRSRFHVHASRTQTDDEAVECLPVAFQAEGGEVVSLAGFDNEALCHVVDLVTLAAVGVRHRIGQAQHRVAEICPAVGSADVENEVAKLEGGRHLRAYRWTLVEIGYRL